MTLLERWDAVGAALAEVRPEEIRKAIVDAERLRAEVDALTQSRNNAVKEAGKVILDLRADLKHWQEARRSAVEAGGILKAENDRLRDELAERARDEVALIEQAARLTAELAEAREGLTAYIAVASGHEMEIVRHMETVHRLRAERDALYRLCLTMYSAHHTQSVVDAALKEGK